MLARNSLKLLLPALNRESAAGAGSPRARQLPSVLFAPRAPGTPTASHPRCYSTRTAIHENMFRRVARVGGGGEKPLPAQRGGARPPLIRGMPVPLPPSRRGGVGGRTGQLPGAGAANSCWVRQVQGRSGSLSPGGTIWSISHISSFISPSARPRGGAPGGAAPPRGTGIRHYPGITGLSRETLILYNRGSISPFLVFPHAFLPPSLPPSQAGAAARQREAAGAAAGGARRLRPRLGEGARRS